MATGILARAGSLFSWRRIWGLALTALGLIGQAAHWGWHVLDVFGRLDVLWRIVETMGGTAAMVAAVISSWQFSLGLIVVGVLYTVFVGEPKRGTQRDGWWPYAAASVFFICLAAMTSVAIYGWFEMALRRAYAAGATGVPRMSASGNPDHQRPLSFSDLNLTPDQTRILTVESSKLKAAFPTVIIATAPRDNAAWQVREQFNSLLVRAGVNVGFGSDILPAGLDEVGFMIAVPDPNNLPESALKFREMLEIADIHPKIVNSTNRIGVPNASFVFFIGPRPMN